MLSLYYSCVTRRCRNINIERLTMVTQQRILRVFLHNNDLWRIHVAGNIVTYLLLHVKCQICMYVYIGFETFFYVVLHLDSIASYLPTGLELGFFCSWPSLFLPSSFSSVFLVLSSVLAST